MSGSRVAAAIAAVAARRSASSSAAAAFATSSSSSTAKETGLLSMSGQLFFGSLCAGTFGLGCWQTARYFEKEDLIAERRRDLSLHPLPLPPATATAATDDDDDDEDAIPPPTSNERSTQQQRTSPPKTWSFRRRLVEGRFRHESEVLVGPRGPPPFERRRRPASAEGNKTNATTTTTTTTTTTAAAAGGGMSISPQGYYVVTPLVDELSGRTVLVNRGWVPRRAVPIETETNQKENRVPPWDRPTEKVKVIGIVRSPEKPRFMVPEPDVTKRPIRFFWMDQEGMERHAGIIPPQGWMLTQVVDDHDEDHHHQQHRRRQQEQQQQQQQQQQRQTGLSLQHGLPLQRPLVENVGEYRTTPLIHAGYAVTWFGLAGAGIYMTRKLITRGRA